MTPDQCRSARALLNWSADDLAARSGVSVASIRNFERGATALMPQNERAVQQALESAGIEFIPGGVRRA
jgi:transcriptional regulator with XRE-family HTH domain